MNLEKIKTEKPWILFKICNVLYGISSEYISSINILEKTTSVPNAPEYIRGVLNLRGKIIQLIDFRRLLQMQSIPNDVSNFEEMLSLRKQDHLNWLKELENSVTENRAFTLTTDPHACAFGKWFDSFSTEDITMNSLLRQVDRVHRKIHSIAIDINKFRENNDYLKIESTLNSTRDKELAELSHLFASIAESYKQSKKEVVLVIEKNKKIIGVIVDEIVSVEKLNTDLNENTIGLCNDFLSIGKKNNGLPVIIVDDDYLSQLCQTEN